MACRGFLQCLLKLFNFALALVGVLLLVYSVSRLVHLDPDLTPPSPKPPSSPPPPSPSPPSPSPPSPSPAPSPSPSPPSLSSSSGLSSALPSSLKLLATPDSSPFLTTLNSGGRSSSSSNGGGSRRHLGAEGNELRLPYL
ncbi:hypothetical protein CLOP_g25057, partial [Closterium sp. NIES-67]